MELKLWPHCGGKAQIDAFSRNYGMVYVAYCPRCHAMGRASVGEETAVEAWNRRHEPPNPPLTLDELRTLPEKEWVWIECIEPLLYTNGSAYYCKIDSIRPEVMFECGYPGWKLHE